MWWISGFLMGAGFAFGLLALYRRADRWQREERPRPRPRFVLEPEPEAEPEPEIDGRTVYLDASNEQLGELIRAVYSAAYPKKRK